MNVTIKDIEQNLHTLPDNLLERVNEYVDFLKETVSGNIPEWQRKEVLKRVNTMDRYPETIISEQEMSFFLRNLESEN